MGNCLKTSHAHQDLEEEVSLKSFRVQMTIGKGTFCKVFAVQHKRSNKTYALKCLPKNKDSSHASKSVVREREILQLLNHHNLLVNLRWSFENEHFFFFVIDYMDGGDLRFHLDERRPSERSRARGFPEDTVRFWVSQVALALDFLHKKNIIHRDVKPENLLLDQEGHVHLGDFNVATKYDPQMPNTSLAGTRNYMSPEMLSRTSYGPAIDFWALGVVMYELLVGRKPYRARNEDELLRMINRKRPEFPPDVDLSPEAKSVVLSLLEINPDKRMNLASMKSHPFFANVNFERIEALQIPSPFVPDKTRTNFDIMYAIEDAFEGVGLFVSPSEVIPSGPRRPRRRAARNCSSANSLVVNSTASCRDTVVSLSYHPPPRPGPQKDPAQKAPEGLESIKIEVVDHQN